jgi:phosphoglycolate phosphatase-like HAD superfamily hydrolase|tara:strand:- start:1086 stop:1727 length:642 start_codon:yes stop_codon:yes gene_type:complete
VILDLIKEAETIFWDFDGVIKDSVSVKSDAFEELFQPFGNEVSIKVKKHHEENGGMSRFDKLPIYLEWARKNSSKKLVLEYETKFSELVMQQVVDSPWVAGVLDYLEKNANKQQFFIVTATPNGEIIKILEELKITGLFKHVIGSPTSKKIAIKQLLSKYKIKLEHALMIGDSKADYDAAIENKVQFILRNTELNKKLQKQLKCKKINNFLNE